MVSLSVMAMLMMVPMDVVVWLLFGEKEIELAKTRDAGSCMAGAAEASEEGATSSPPHVDMNAR